jgi:type IV pilus assembly protein PilV
MEVVNMHIIRNHHQKTQIINIKTMDNKNINQHTIIKNHTILKNTQNIKHHNQIKPNNQRGYLMVEVLVCLLIFSTAMIALIALQLNAFTSNQSASNRAIAINYANDLLEKMRANKEGVINGSYVSLAPSNGKCRSVNFNTTNTAIDCVSSVMAQDDLTEFNSQVASSLPRGKGIVCIDSAQSKGTPTNPNCDNLGNTHVIKIFWRDKSSKDLGRNNGYSQVVIGGNI